MAIARSSNFVRFSVFEVDLRAGELLKQGVKIKLPEQSFQILAMLLQRPGQLVTREEIQKGLWPDDTIVEFENSINAAIRRLRLALGDSADEPKFVETLARRGYRFMIPVETVSDALSGAVPRQGVLLEAAAVVEPPVSLDGSLPMRTLRRWRKWHLVLAGSTILIAAVFTYRLIRPLPLPKVLGSTQITMDGRLKFGPILTDGARLYFIEGPPYTICQVSTSGGEVSQISSPVRTRGLLDISPSGSDLLIREAGSPWQPAPLWVLPAAGGTPRRVGDVAAFGAAWLADGQQIVYENSNNLYVCRSDGSEARKLATVPTEPNFFAFWLEWSPDGSRLRFGMRDRRTHATLRSFWEVSANGTDLRPLSQAYSAGNWTPDGKYFVFAPSKRGRMDLWAVREKTELFRRASTEPTQLTSGPLSLSFPVSSKDGRKLFVLGTQQRTELVRYDAQSGHFLPYLGGISADGVSFSSDGQWTAYVSFPDATLWRSRMDGSERRQLTFSPMAAFNPRWSPDGKSIAFQAEAPGKPIKIYIVSADGGGPRQVTTGPRNDVDPNWSPDGQSLVFADGAFGKMPDDSMRIDRIDLRTNEVSSLPGSQGLMSPQWSPSGRYVDAFTTDWQKLMLFDFTTQEWVELCAGRRLNWHYWSRHGNYIYFSDNLLSGNAPSIERLRISDRKIEKVVALEEVGRLGIGNLGGPWTGLALDDSPLVLRDIGTQEIYALDVEFP